MRVCHVITRFVRGGADENTLLTCNAQADLGHEVTLVYGREHHARMRDALRPAVLQIMVPTLVRELSAFDDLRALRDCVNLFKRLKPDVVHTHTSKAGIVGRFAARIAKVPLIIHGVHIVPWLNVGPAERGLYLALERAAALTTQAFVDVAEEIRDVYVESGVGQPSSHFVVSSGMDTDRFRDAGITEANWRELVSPELITTAKPKFLVHVSALEERKRQSEFLDVFARIARVEQNAILLLVGEGNARSGIEARIAELKLEGRVVCVGYRPDVERWIALARVCLLTSLREGLARVLVQYALVARPIVATDIPGTRTIVKRGENGFLVDVRNLSAMEQPIRELLEDDNLYERMVAANRRLDLSAWGLRAMSERMESVYRATRR